MAEKRTRAKKVAEPDAATTEPVAATKKAKKPVKVVAVVTPNGIEGSFTPEPRRPLIAHLTVNSSEFMFTEGSATTEPEPFNPSTADMFAADQEAVQPVASETPEMKEADKVLYGDAPAAQSETRPLQCFAKVGLMVQFGESAKAKALPESTDIACFWCAHTFDWMPCIIPEREVASVYNVYGNFCCPECAFAYLLQESMDPHVRWERVALLHRLYDREGKGRMFPAPGRETLSLFGGPMTIESYRATMRAGKVRIDTHMPPMVSILGSIDTKPIDFFDSSLKNTLIGSLQQEKTAKAEEGLRLKRSKPLKDKESTLDSVMNIQIRGKGIKA
jgi:hypothetical protein